RTDPGTRATAWYDGVLTPGVSDATVREIADRARRIASYRAAVADFYDVSPDEGTHAARERAAERFDDLPSDLDADDIAALLRTEG
ncbi:hypothetical protein, partial [Halarchaeum acidiphilum]|uniref:hypothetical protein n=1 Tax=Halarchaeum acidiphilum TaxID=489138 RepID=UPI0005D1E4D4